MSEFIQVKPEQFVQNPFDLAKTWMLVTAEKEGKVNTMTAGWGGLGVMWQKNVAYVVIRPSRYTKEFVDHADHFSLTFFSGEFRETLTYLGTRSGRDEDKIKNKNLTILHENGVPYFEEASLVILCKKLYAQEFTGESFIEQTIIDKSYPTKDFHTLYIAEVTQILKKSTAPV